MALPIWQRTITDNQGNVIPSAEVLVVVEATGLEADIFSNRSGTTPRTNPFFTGSDGFAQFYAAPGEYRIEATGPTGSIVWRWNVLAGDAALRSTGTGATEVPTNGDLGTMAQQDANNVNITGGNITANALTSGTVPSARISGNYTGIDRTAAVFSHPSDTGSVTTSHLRAVVASQNSTASGDRSAIVASSNSTVSGDVTAIVAGTNSTVSDNRSAIVATANSTVSGSNGAVVASRRVVNDINSSLTLGDAPGGDALTGNRKIHLFSTNGNVSIAGSLTQGASFSDFAEMMPNATGAEIPAGTVLTMIDGEVRPANEGEEICGVVSHTAAILAGDSPFCWQGRYLTDEFGKRIYETIPDADWEPSEGETEADRPMQTVLKENPEWNPDLPQVPRSERPDEWTPVGLVGQVFVRTGEQVKAGDRITAKGGLGYATTERTGLKVMKVTKDFDGNYGIAKCLINVMV